MKVLMIQPHTMRFELGGKRSPTNRSGLIYNIMREASFDITIGTTIARGEKTIGINNELITEGSKLDDYDRIVLLSGTFNYCFPPSYGKDGFDNKLRCLYALKHTSCPVIMVQDEYITDYAGYPALIKPIKRLWKDNKWFNENDDLHKGRTVKILMQTCNTNDLANAISDNMNMYSTLKYEFINWGVQYFAFSDTMLKPRLEPQHIMTYIGVMRPNRSRLQLINNKRTNVFGRWKHPLDKVKQYKGLNVVDVPYALNSSVATIWTHDDSFKGMSVESARLYEAVRSGCPLLIDETMWKDIKECYLSGIDCFFSTKKELWKKVSDLYKYKNYREDLIIRQQRRLKQTILLDGIREEFIDCLVD